MSPTHTFTVAPDESRERLDKLLATRLPQLSRSLSQSLIKKGAITLNGATVKPRSSVAAGDLIRVELPEPESEQILPEKLPLDLLHEDPQILVVNKAPGMVVHPGVGHRRGTLVNALLHHCGPDLASTGDPDRPGIVHRLDKDTSGCLVVAKTAHAQRELAAQFAARTTRKLYLAVVERGPKEDAGTVHTHLARHPVHRMKRANVESDRGKEALTDYRVLTRHPDSSLLLCRIHTGRTHQIRVHCLTLGCPILGDELYANLKRQTPPADRLMLHAWQLQLRHPTTGEILHFLAPSPGSFHPWMPSEEALAGHSAHLNPET
ncbi:MAG: RluA family pseudouridine synthase [Verrucomicrobiota bacterium]